ncbi:MAG: carboxypeptidase regulatory-like domain-containing protein [Desulfobacteraceae bacterium]|nr:carboxypeptidase regulatory-like domain-containing protein [Desulfobacteraceae bacterium]
MLTSSPISEAEITTDAHASAISRPNGDYMIIHTPGTFSMTVRASGYEDYHISVSVKEGDTSVIDVQLTPIYQPPQFSTTIYLSVPDFKIEVSEEFSFAIGQSDRFNHSSTQWQIAEDAEFSRLISDIRTSEYLTELYVPPLILQSEKTIIGEPDFMMLQVLLPCGRNRGFFSLL